MRCGRRSDSAESLFGGLAARLRPAGGRSSPFWLKLDTYAVAQVVGFVLSDDAEKDDQAPGRCRHGGGGDQRRSGDEAGLGEPLGPPRYHHGFILWFPMP